MSRLHSRPVHLQAPTVRIVGTQRNSVVVLEPDNQPWIAGRGEDSTILLDDSNASRKHFEIISNAGKYFIRDLSSANGTVLNGRTLGAYKLTALASGDVIRVGRENIFFEYQLARSAAAVDAPAEVLSIDHRPYQQRSVYCKIPSRRPVVVYEKRSWLSEFFGSIIAALAG